MNDTLVQALMGSGSPEEMEQMRQYEAMLQRYPKFAPSQPTITGGDIGDAIRGVPMPNAALQDALVGGSPPMPQNQPPQPQQDPSFMDVLRQMGPGLRQLYWPKN